MGAYSFRIVRIARRGAALLPTCLALASLPVAAEHAAQHVSEHDYFGDLPVVLSVSRLAQPLNEVPGAVTVIDREFIRRSGARDLTDLLRLVPGFVVGHINGANPIANYHGDFDALNRRLQVFVDGRSIYSSLLAGNVSHPMMGMVLDDIERIEVLRGSNSAAYGANAFSGVVNVVTRTATDVPRFSTSLALGEKGIADRSVRAAWGDERLAVRLTAARSGDSGFDNVIDDKRVDQLHLRADLHPSAADDVILAAGSVRHQWGATDMPRNENWRNVFVQGQWRHSLDADNDLRFNASFDEEKFVDQVFYFTLLGASRPYRADGTGRRLSLEAEHTARLSSALRLVWGGQWRHEEVRSPDLLGVKEAQTAELRRLFGNIEWRLGEKWIVNAGAMWEDHSVVGPRTAPRISLAYRVLPGHTLRVGSTHAYRMPTMYELRGNWQTPSLPGSLVLASGGIKPERLVANEIGYVGEFRPLGLTVDLRGFEESGSSIARYFGGYPNDVVNKDRYRKRGWETQLRWKPRPETQLFLNHTVLNIRAWATGDTHISDELSAPSHTSSLVWFESLAAGFEFGLSYLTYGAMTWGGKNDVLDTQPRLDLRLARRFKLGGTQAEAAVVTHSATGSYQDGDPRRYFPRRAFATLRLDF
ncbi:MAG: TonB-dependent receptor [Sulfuritalea sp.]|nr:TonB-dependent receptor [Sulfuritalea sp.]